MNKRMKLYLLASILLGLVVRLICLDAMEWKEDEQFNFNQSQQLGKTIPWPWYGIGSGVYIPNPGLSVWMFAALAKISNATTPLQLQAAIGILGVLGVCLILPFALRAIQEPSERILWFLAMGLVLVNPFHVVYERKLWPEGFLPLFSILTFWGWWNRSRFGYSFLWGLMAALVGQAHMSGFFFAAAIFIWTLFFGRRLEKEAPGISGTAPPRWNGFWLGTAMGILPLIPWFIHIATHPGVPPGQSVGSGWNEIFQFKYWVFWLTDPTGLHLGNPLGLLRSQSLWGQIEDFVRYPVLFGVPTYINGIAHTLIAFLVLHALGTSGARWLKSPSEWRSATFWLGTRTPTRFLMSALLIGCGLLLTLTSVRIRRYYMVVTTPFEFIFLLYCLGASLRPGRYVFRKVALLWICEVIISFSFVQYVHLNDGAPQGDYGISYRKQLQNAAERQEQ